MESKRLPATSIDDAVKEAAPIEANVGLYDGKVIVTFPAPVTLMVMTKDEARRLANLILQCVKVGGGNINGS